MANGYIPAAVERSCDPCSQVKVENKAFLGGVLGIDVNGERQPISDAGIVDLTFIEEETREAAEQAIASAQAAAESEQTASEAAASARSSESAAQTAANAAEAAKDDAEDAARSANSSKNTAESHASAAQTAAAAAQVADGNAERSAESAIAAAAQAASSAGAAQQYANEAYTSASTAQTASGAAQDAQTAAEASASTASSAATTATQAATDAQAAQSSAEAAQSAAASSATAASGSATAAAGSATQAAASATAADASAAAAAQSAAAAQAAAMDVIDKAGVITDTASGAIASFPDGADEPIKQLTVNIQPQQDLHGYDAPWPAGGGANKFGDYTVVNGYIPASGKITAANDNRTYVFKAKPNTDYAFLINRVIQSGQSANDDYAVAEFSGDTAPTIGSVGTRLVSSGYVIPSGGSRYTRGSGTFTTASDTQWLAVKLANTARTDATATAEQTTFEESTTIPTAWTPYSNICPITGWTGANVWDDPKHGGTINFNQLLEGGNFASTDGWYAGRGTIAASNNKLTYTATEKSTYQYVQHSFAFNQRHKILIMVDVTLSEAQAVAFGNGSTLFGQKSVAANTKTSVSYIVNSTSGYTALYLYPGRTSGLSVDATAVVENFMFFDLTQMFGAGNEPSTFDEFKALFPLPYYAYNTGEDTCVSAVNGDPYRHYPITWQTEAGTVYGGTLTVEQDGTGTLVVERRYVIFGSASDYTWNTGSGVPYLRKNLSSANKAKYSKRDLTISNQYSQITSTSTTNKAIRITSDGAAIFIYDSRFTNEATANTLTAANPIEVVYPLATPITYTLTASQMRTLLGQNNWWADCGDIENIEYRADTKLYIDKKLAALLAALS